MASLNLVVVPFELLSCEGKADLYLRNNTNVRSVIAQLAISTVEGPTISAVESLFFQKSKSDLGTSGNPLTPVSRLSLLVETDCFGGACSHFVQRFHTNSIHHFFHLYETLLCKLFLLI
jgi:hypothetical protein